MDPFCVYSKQVQIGYSNLEMGDPPMGVAFGRFVPSDEYRNIQALVIACREQTQEHFEFSVFQPNGALLPNIGINIQDFSPELGPEEIEMAIMGIPYPLYQELFPSHVEWYEKQFSNK